MKHLFVNGSFTIRGINHVRYRELVYTFPGQQTPGHDTRALSLQGLSGVFPSASARFVAECPPRFFKHVIPAP